MPESMVITGLGMRTAVGNSAAETCASIRAGVNRFCEWPFFSTGISDEGPAGITAAATVPPLGDSHWTSKAIELLVHPAIEALTEAGIAGTSKGNRRDLIPSIYLATPQRDRPGQLDDADPEEIYSGFLEEMRSILGELIGPRSISCFPHGHVAGIAAMARATSDILEGKTRIALAGGVDSLLDSSFLLDLHEKNSLKSENSSSGLIPGEAAAFVVIESAASAAERGATPLARIVSCAMNKDSMPWGDEQAISGTGLTNALRSAVEQAGGGEGFRKVVADLNGERIRFLEWATVETRFMHEFPRGWTMEHPADCTGDVGAAFGTMAVGLVARSFHRNYGANGGVAICSSSPSGERAVATVFPFIS